MVGISFTLTSNLKIFCIVQALQNLFSVILGLVLSLSKISALKQKRILEGPWQTVVLRCVNFITAKMVKALLIFSSMIYAAYKNQ